MKVVQILPELNEGGVERGVVELNRELVKHGIHSMVISNGGKLESQIESNGGLHIKLNVCSKNPLTAPWRIYKLAQTIKKITPNIVHVRSRVPAWLMFCANKFVNVKVVSTVHGFNSVNFYSRIMTKADRVICVSYSIKEYIQKHYKIDEQQTSVIPRGVDINVFNPQNLDAFFMEDFTKKYNLQNSFIVSIVGRITQLKDLESFIQAIALLKTKKPNIKALIVGSVREDKKSYFESLKTLCKSLHIQNNILFVGSQSKVAEIYMLSNVVVSSSKKPESFGRSVAEAIALNTPVIATNHGGVKDIVSQGENGFLVPPKDPEALSEAILKAEHLHVKGFEYIKTNFSLEQMVAKTLQVYGELA